MLVGMLAARKNPKRKAARLRDPERTRERLLQAAAREIYRSGFQSASLDSILGVAGVTKGALYHHFENKEALGYAVVDEMIAGSMSSKWLRPLREGDDPIATLSALVDAEPMTPRDIALGCPLNTLSLEMSPLDEGFRQRLARVFDSWREGVAEALRLGQDKGLVRRDLEAADVALFFVATYEGYVALAKTTRDQAVWRSGKMMLKQYLSSLRPTTDP